MPTRSTWRRFGAVSLALGALALSGCAYFAKQLPPERAPVAPAAEAPQQMAERWRMPADPAEAEPALQAILARAGLAGWPVAIADSPGSLDAPGGLLIDMRPYRAMALDPKNRLLRVRAGATWKEVLSHLHARGFSPLVMQPHGDFTVGGSLSVNSHGLQPASPIAHSVLAFSIMLADGRVVRCSRSERSELFKLAIGGYGLFGVILEAELRVVPNARYRIERHFVAPEQFAQRFATVVGRDAALAHGRFSVAPGSFLREGILTVYTRAPGAASAAPLPAADPTAAVLRRYLHDAIGTTGGKMAYWEAEKRADTGLHFGYATRNQLLNACAESLETPEQDGRTLNQIYFVPRRQFARFISTVRQLLPRAHSDLIAASVSAVGPDGDTFLRYADQDMFALSLLFHQRGGEAEERAMGVLTQRLIDAVLPLKGRYHLASLPHATAVQFAEAYPAGSRFFDAKRRYDPDERFAHPLYAKYARGL